MGNISISKSKFTFILFSLIPISVFPQTAPQKYYGGSGDGYGQTASAVLSIGIVSNNKYYGGSADGYSVSESAVLAMGYTADLKFKGGDGDGYGSGAVTNSIGYLETSKYYGGSGDGYSQIAVVNTPIGFLADSKYKGGSGSGYSMSFSDQSLPVELTDFKATVSENIIRLNWTTATELNNMGFSVQLLHEGDNALWQDIGFVNGHGTSTSQRHYSFSYRNYLKPGTYSVRLKQTDTDGTFVYSNILALSINNYNDFTLEPATPNPANPVTIIGYFIPLESNVSLIVYDMTGREVAKLVSAFQPAGYYTVQFNASNLSSGVYMYRITAGRFTKNHKITILK